MAPAAWAKAPTLSQVAAAEKGVRGHDQALLTLAIGLEDWLSGRADLQAIRQAQAAAKRTLASPLGLPKASAAKVAAAENGILSAMSRFTSSNAPDAEGQRALFSSLNGFNRDRSLALLEWRAANNSSLRSAAPKGAAADYLKWEAAWIPLWKSEVSVTYRLQASALKADKVDTDGTVFVRELLAVQAKAAAIATPKDAEPLQDLATRRLTLLARTAEQLDRLGRGESRGALTRVRRLNKEQAELGRLLQDQRLALLLKGF